MKVSTRLRRVRGAVSLATTWAITWGAASGVRGGLGMAVVGRLYDHPVSWTTMAGAFALAGALAGAVSGLGFAVIVAATGRRRSLDLLSPVRLGLWSALPACAIGAALFGMDPYFVTATTLFGVGAGAATMKLARRGDELALESGEPAALPTGT